MVCNREADQLDPELRKQKPLAQWKLLKGKCIPFPRAAKSFLIKESQSNEGAGKHTGNYKIVGTERSQVTLCVPPVVCKKAVFRRIFVEWEFE